MVGSIHLGWTLSGPHLYGRRHSSESVWSRLDLSGLHPPKNYLSFDMAGCTLVRFSLRVYNCHSRCVGVRRSSRSVIYDDLDAVVDYS